MAITSSRPQTTRHTIRGIVHRDDYQLILVDTPGIHRPRTLLGERLNNLVAGTLSQVDVLGFCIPANEKIGPGDRYIASQLVASSNKPVVAIVTKSDTVGNDQLSEQLIAVQAQNAPIEPAGLRIVRIVYRVARKTIKIYLLPKVQVPQLNDELAKIMSPQSMTVRVVGLILSRFQRYSTFKSMPLLTF